MKDIVLINPGDRKQVFQDLASLAAIEPPFWIAVIAAYLREKGFDVSIIDASAENISPEETADLVAELNPLLTAVIVYGSQPSASTQNMTIAGRICTALKKRTKSKVAIGGLHPSALPKQTIEEEDVDFVIDGEGPLTLELLIPKLKSEDPEFSDIRGLWCKNTDGAISHSERFPVIKDLDTVLPVAAWDLLPMEKYLAHNWHCFDDIEHRQPYGALYTSLGCPFQCVFCCINAPFGKPSIRYRSPERVLEEIDVLVQQYGVKNIKIVDELFVLKPSHYMTIVDMIIERGYDLNIWVYARVDTIDVEVLPRMKEAGINWFALGIESANPDVRDGASKQMKADNIKEVVQQIQDAGIRVIGNYIFGLPNDTLETMQETLDMAIDLNCEFSNFYCAMAYPGSKLYDIAIQENWALPDSWHGFSQHAFESKPLSTNYLAAEEVLEFRDKAFHQCFENEHYLNMLEEKFGADIKNHIIKITKHKLKRKILQ